MFWPKNVQFKTPPNQEGLNIGVNPLVSVSIRFTATWNRHMLMAKALVGGGRNSWPEQLNFAGRRCW